MEDPIEMDDLGITNILGNLQYIYIYIYIYIFIFTVYTVCACVFACIYIYIQGLSGM